MVWPPQSPDLNIITRGDTETLRQINSTEELCQVLGKASLEMTKFHVLKIINL